MSMAEEKKRLREHKRQTSNMVSKHNSEETNPCFKEGKLSLKCLMENNCDREICTPYFVNYQVCKKFWGEIVKTRRRAGMEPYLPPVEERPKIVDDYLKSKAESK